MLNVRNGLTGVNRPKTAAPTTCSYRREYAPDMFFPEELPHKTKPSHPIGEAMGSQVLESSNPGQAFSPGTLE